MIAFKRSKNLQEIIGGHTAKHGKVFKKNLTRLNGNSMPCSSTRPSLCCTQVLNTQTFTSQWTKRTFNIFHKLTCKSQYVMNHAKFILIKQLTELSNVSKDTLRLRLKRREDFWIIKLETLAPKGLNQPLNNVWSPITPFSVHSILIYCSEEESDAIMTYPQIYDVK